MPRKALRCLVDINVQCVTCPGVWLPRRDDVFLSIQLLGQIRRSQLATPIFPLLFHERFRFDKVFYTAFEPAQVAEALEDETVLIEVIQLSSIYEGGRLLASYEGRARDFLYPYPTYSVSYGTDEREVLLERSLDFPGISPKLEFSTKTVIKETSVPVVAADFDNDLDLYGGRTSRSSGRRSRSRTRSPSRQGTYKRPTISSIYRTRSMSPSLRRRMEELDLADTALSAAEDRPPFVVRKVDSQKLIGRTPGRLKKNQAACMHGSGYRYFTDDYLDNYTYRPWSYSQVARDPLDPYPLYDRSVPSWSDPEDAEVARLTSSYYSSPVRPRTTSPLYPSTLVDRYSERSWSPSRSALISDRVDRALRRNRSLERLDRLSNTVITSPMYRSYDRY